MAEEEEFKLTFWIGVCTLGQMISEGASHLYTVFTTPPPQPAPYQPTAYDRTFPQDLLPGRPGPQRYAAPAREPPRLQLPVRPPPVEQPLSPLGRIPGGWEGFGEVEEPVVEGEDVVESVTDNAEQDVRNAGTVDNGLEVKAEGQKDGLGQANSAPSLALPSTSNQLPPSAHSDTPQLPNDDIDATLAGPSNHESNAALDVNSIPLVLEPSSSSATQLPPSPSLVAQQTSRNEGDRISNHSREDSQTIDSSRPVSPFSPPSKQNDALQVPAAGNNHGSDDRSSISSAGGASSAQGSSTPKKSWLKKAKNVGRRAVEKIKPGSGTPSPSKPPSAPTAGSASPPAQPQAAEWPTIDTNNQNFVQLARHGITTFAELSGQLAPLPYLSNLLGPFQSLFEAIEMARTNKKQWHMLRRRCVTGSLLIASQIKLVQQDEERHKTMTAVCQEVADVIKRITESAINWNKMPKVQSFIMYRQMSEDIERFFGQLDSALKLFSIGSRTLAEQWTGEFAARQKEEFQQLQGLLVQVQDGNADLETTIIAGQNATQSTVRKIEEKLDRMLKEHWERGQRETGVQKMNIQLTIGLILSVTGLSIPADVFHGPVCTNLSADPIKRAATCDVYQATLGDEKVAKKVFYLNHSAEKTVEAYARKISRDAKLWSSFQSDYILKFYGVGMEPIEGPPGNFKLYMLSPMLPNSDAISYLEEKDPQAKERRQTIGNRQILRIIMDAARGLQYLHHKGVIHSGMRGDNVLIRESGQGVLGGFGLTKALQNRDETDELASLAMTGEASSGRWMAPELFRSSSQPMVTKASDVWGWAMAALHIITGQVPFHTTRREDLVISQIREDPTTSQKDYPDFKKYAHQPGALWALLKRCWDLEPRKRPTIDEVLKELARIDAL